MPSDATAAAVWTDFDPTSQEFWEDPVAYLQPAHPDAPVFHWEEANTWVIAGYEEAVVALKDFETFSSQQTMAGKQVTVDSAGSSLAEHQRIVDSILTNQLLLTDPPQHTARRKLQQKGFKRPRIEALQPFIQEHADTLIDDFIGDGSADIMQQFSYLFSIGVIGRVLGVYPTDLPKLREGIEAFSMLRGAATGDARSVERVADEVAKAFETVAGPYWYFEKWVSDRSAAGHEDIAADLAAARTPEGEPTLTSGQIVSYMVGLVVAGTDTTANLIGNIVRYLSEQPDAREEILAEPELWEPAIEEGLRRSANTPSAFRATTKDVEIGGAVIPAGSKVMVSIAGANGDAEKFPDPLRFDVHRDDVGDHLGFGIGRHFCLGAPLARSEARIALETLYRRLPGLTVDLDEPQQFMRLAVPRIRMRQTVTWSS